MTFRRMATVALVAGLYGAGVAQAIEYFNLTRLDKDGNEIPLSAVPPTPNTTTNPAINGAIFTTDPKNYPDGFGRIVGTGVIDPFLRVHRNNANCGQKDPCTEYGYNTSGDGSKSQPLLGAKEKEGHLWNHTLKLGDIGTVTREDGKLYRVFALDINEPNANGQQNRDDFLLSLDQFRIFVSDKEFLDVYSCGGLDCGSQLDHRAPGTSTYNPNAHTLSGSKDGVNYSATKIFDLDTGIDPNNDQKCDSAAPLGTGATKCDRTLALNSQWTSGSGNGVDMVVYVPDEVFDKTKQFVYLFSSFGELGKNDNKNNPAANLPSGDFGQAGGFEEWYTLKSATPIAPTLALFGLGFVLMSTMRRKMPLPRNA